MARHGWRPARRRRPTINRGAAPTVPSGVFASGAAATHAERLVRRLWRAETARRERLGLGADGGEDALAVSALPPLQDVAPPQRDTPALAAGIRFAATVSDPAASPVAFGPRMVRVRILEEMTAIIRSAERFIVIETPCLTDPALVAVLSARMKAAQDLNLIVVTPKPEWTGRPRERHRSWLQTRALARLTRRFGDRVGAFVAPDTRSGAAGTGSAGAGHDSPRPDMTVMIADDRVAVIASGDLSPRTLRMDTAIALSFGGDAAGQLRERLWRRAFGDAAQALSVDVSSWSAVVAEAATQDAGEARSGIHRWPAKAGCGPSIRRLLVPSRFN